MSRQSRREFFKAAGLAGAGLVTSVTPASASTTHLPSNDQFGMLYDATKCVGCKACMAACKRVNARPGGLAFEQARFDEDGLWDAPEDLDGNTRTLIKLYKDTKGWSYIKYSCMHCQNPSCVSVCPVSAMTKDPKTGIVDYSKDTCIGCRYCQVACPFNIPKFQWDRTVPQIVKCDLCRDTNLKTRAYPRAPRPAQPARSCLASARTCWRKRTPASPSHPQRYVPHIYGEHEIGGTNHLYLAGLPFDRLGLPTLKSEAPASFSERIQHTIYKGFIAPVALYVSLCCIAVRNQKKGEAQHTAAAAAQPKDS